jgi:hypothetical protein
MFKLLGKKNSEEESKAQAADKIIKENLDKEIIVHVMPKLFLNVHSDAKKAKSTGILILISGAIFLIAAGFGFYYLVFKLQPAAKVPVVTDNEQTEATSTEQPAVTPEVPATTSPEITTEAATTTTATSTNSVTLATSTAGTINLTPAKDTDQDGLTDDEEALLGTDPNKQDTDGDGYNDLAEVIKLYNPTGPGKITDDPKIKVYSNEAYDYSFDYPADWATSSPGGDDVSVVTTIKIGPSQTADSQVNSINSQFMQVNVSPNEKKQSINDWYKEQFNLTQIDPNNIVNHLDANGLQDWQGVKNQDGLTVYLTDKNNSNIYTINYDVPLGEILNFPNIFNLVVASFSLSN